MVSTIGQYEQQVTLKDVRDVSWGKSYLWNAKFYNPYESENLLPSATNSLIVPSYISPPEPPEKFKSWFPAYTVSEPVFSIQTMNVKTPLINFPIPKTLSNADLSISFYDDDKSSIRKWISNWCLHMFNLSVSDETEDGKVYISRETGSGVRTLSECIMGLSIKKFTSDHIITTERDYLVFPSQNFVNSMDSESNADTFQATFSIVSGIYKTML